MKTGRLLCNFKFRNPCRAGALSVGDGLAVITTDRVPSDDVSRIHVVRMTGAVMDYNIKEVKAIDVDRHRIRSAYFHDVNRYLITAHEDGSLGRWDVEKGQLCGKRQTLHEEIIKDLKISEDGTYFIAASGDKTSKLVDTDTDAFKTIKVYSTDRLLNSADISPRFDHILLGGGQDPEKAATTETHEGMFESLFFHKIYAEKFGFVRGHFGRINTVTFHPDGRSFSTGGDDGYVRIHYLDDDYFKHVRD